MEESLDSAMKTLSRLQSNDSASSDDSIKSSFFRRHSREEVLEFVTAAKELHAILQQLNSPSFSYSKKLTSAQNLLRATMKRLGREFFSLLKANKEHLYPNAYTNSGSLSDHGSGHSGGGSITDGTDSLSGRSNGSGVGVGVEEVSAAMDDLKVIADCMIATGYGKKCLKIYRITRRSVVEDSIVQLRVKIRKSRIQKMDWEEIQKKMDKWSKASRFAVRQIFLGENILCDHLFASSSSPTTANKHVCFSDVCKDSAIILLKIPGKLAEHTKKSREMVFRFLDLYNDFSELYLDIGTVFCSDFNALVRSMAISSLNRIADAVRVILSDFESCVQKEASKIAIPGGGVYPLTRYVMNYLTSLVSYADALEKILDEYRDNLMSCLPETYFEDGTTSPAVSLWFAWQILVLLCKLDAKSEIYNEAALTYLFLANNLQYVISKVSGSKLESILGETWVPKHAAKVLQYTIKYEMAGWDKVVNVFPKDQNTNMPLDKVKESFKEFNNEFEAEYRKQVEWFAVDEKLKNDIKDSVSRKIIDRYRFMYDKYSTALMKHRAKGVIEKVIKFTPEELETYMMDLLDGSDVDDHVVSMGGEGGSGQTGSDSANAQQRHRSVRLFVRHLRGKDSKDKEGSVG